MAGVDILLNSRPHLVWSTQDRVIRWRNVLSPANGRAANPQSFFAVICENIRNQNSVVILRNFAANLCGVTADRFDARRDFAGGHGRNKPPIGESPRASESGLAAATDPNWRSAVLIRARQQSQISNRIELSLICDLLLCPQFLHQ